MRVFFDTSAIYAFIDANEPEHKKVKKYIKTYPGRLVVTNHIFDEIITLTLNKLGHSVAVSVGSILQNSPQIELVWVKTLHERASWELFCQRSDKKYSFTDCTSFVIMRALKIKEALTLDKHFQQEGFKVVLT